MRGLAFDVGGDDAVGRRRLDIVDVLDPIGARKRREVPASEVESVPKRRHHPPDVVAASGPIGDLLEEQDVIAGKYTLEVSSPGVDRPLRTTTQLRRNEGRDLRVVRTREPLTCAPCLSRRCAHEKGPVCMTGLQPADVLAALGLD